MLSRNWIGLDRERQVLMNAAVGPPDPLCVRVFALVRRDILGSAKTNNAVRYLLTNNLDAGHPIRPLVVQPPASKVVRTCHDPWPHSLGHPGTVDVMADPGCDPNEIAGFDVELCRIGRMDPHGIGIAKLVQPFRVS